MAAGPNSRGRSEQEALIFRTILPTSPRLMKMSNFVLGLVAASVCISQAAEAQPHVIRVYDGNDLTAILWIPRAGLIIRRGSGIPNTPIGSTVTTVTCL